MNASIPQRWSDWKITGVMGEGSFGTVYRAEKGNGLNCAIKVIQIPPSKEEQMVMLAELGTISSLRNYYQDLANACITEIQMMASLKGAPNIVSIEDFIVEPRPDQIQWIVYIRMELLTSFSDYTQTHTLAEKDVVRLGIELCNALELCHKRGILHRDIKPDNVFVTQTGQFKLGDFGVARKERNQSLPYSVKGTPAYMAPEVMKGETYGATADLYSLGMLMYRQMNKNRMPFLDPNKEFLVHQDIETAIGRRLKGNPLPPPADASPELAAIILTACAYRPTDRFQSAAQLRRALQGLSNQPAIYESPGYERAKLYQTPTEHSESEVRSHRRSAKPLVLCIVLAGLLAGGIFAASRYVKKSKETILPKQETEQSETVIQTEAETDIETETEKSAETEKQTETERSTETERLTETEKPADTEMTTEAAAGSVLPAETQPEPQPESKETETESIPTTACINGTVVILMTDRDVANGTITIEIHNNNTADISLYGLPKIIHQNGMSSEIDPYRNLLNASGSIVSSSYRSVTYYVGSDFARNGGTLHGELWAMGIYSDMTYNLTIPAEN